MITTLARPEIIKMQAYSSARSKNTNASIYLDANENPYAENNSYNRYPEPQPQRLLNALTALYQIDNKQLLITRGSDEGIDLLVRAFCKAGEDSILICPPTYGMYAVCANIQGAGINKVALEANSFDLDLDAVLQSWQATTKLIFLCSPNNPTGNLLTTEKIVTLCEKLTNKALIIVDEAYIEFADTASLVGLINDFPNLVVLRTLSKAYGLAGVRCGAVIANEAIIALLKKIIAPYPIAVPVVNAVMQKITADSLAVARNIALIKQQRKSLNFFLKNLNFVEKVFSSEANFLFVKVNNSQEIIKKCKQHGIIIRDCNIKDYVRISIGTEKENDQLKEVLSYV